MKFPTTASILALGLALINPAVAANCRPSKPASVSSSSTSSALSSSSSPAGPACTNLVQNGNFADDATGWTLTGSNTFTNPCEGAAGCIDSSASSDFTTSFSQALTTEVGTTYNFDIEFYVWDLSGSNSVVCTMTGSGASGVTTFTLPLDQAISGGWTPYTDTYTAVSVVTTLDCTLTSNTLAEIYFTGISLMC
ncbi:hypothetical protein SEUCBS139899_006955 [Sporothrix eucalyptigena]|uniref:Uncharacterized protein n=1 Tax=Sporothrix eucalyptigena TaxID=1812306 RepID=A0ABP0C3N4_9PEZI